MKNIKLAIQNAITKIKALSVTSKAIIGIGSILVICTVTGIFIYATNNPKPNNDKVVSTTTSTANKNDKNKSDEVVEKDDTKKTDTSSEKNEQETETKEVNSSENSNSTQDTQENKDTSNNNVITNTNSNNSSANNTQNSQTTNNTPTQPSNNEENNSNTPAQSTQQSTPPVDCNTFKSQIMACFFSTINNSDISNPQNMTVTPTYYSNFVNVTEQYFNGSISEGTMRSSISNCNVADSYDEYTTYTTTTNKISCGSILGTNAKQIASQIPIGNTGAVNLRITWNGSQYECKYVAVMTARYMHCD